MSSQVSLDLAGEVFAPGQAGYAEAAATMFATGRPDLVLRPRNAAGVAAALRHAADGGLTVSVRSGGHSMAGFGTHTDGMVIDLRQISHVQVLDVASRRVRIGAGATWAAVSAALQPHGLALTSGDTRSVGVGGLTLGGGIGWMVRRYGLAIDALISADIVTANGRLIRAAPGHHDGLFWALRGGGGNFGVVVSFDFVAQPVSTVHFGTIGYQPGDMPLLIAGWRDLMRTSDENLTTTLAMMPAAAGQPAMAALLCCYADSDSTAAVAALRPFRQLAPVIADDVRLMRYAEVLQDSQVPAGMRFEVRNAFFPVLGEEPIAAVEPLLHGGAAVELRGLGGAMARIRPDATAFAHRDAEAMAVACAMLPEAAPREELTGWASLAALGSGAYVNFLGSATDADVAAAYPPATYQRLAAIKGRYDPANIFRRNHNIRVSPASPSLTR